MKNTTLIIFCIIAVHSYAQKMNNVWVFGDSAGIDFNAAAIPIVSSIDSRGSATSISDTSGNLLFYANTRAGMLGNTTLMWDKNNQVMQNGDSIVGQGWYNELTIVPKSNNNIYYLFSIGEISTGDMGFYYSLIDMNLNNGLGAITQKNKPINQFKNSDCLTAIKHGNGRDWWLFSKENNSSSSQNSFYVYLVLNDSIYPPIIQQFNNSSDAGLGMLCFNNKGSKFIQIHPAGFMCEYDFDRCNGIISNPNLIYPEQSSNFNRIFFAGAYSPDDSKFYLSTTRSSSMDTSYLLQYDLASTDIAASSDTLGFVVEPVQGGSIRLAPDGKIYYTCFYDWGFPGYPYPDSVHNIYNENLGVINYPDSSGTSCNYQPFSFYLGGKRTYYGLPNNPNYSLGPVIGSVCDSLTNGISQINLIQPFNIFPNPARNKLTITQNIKETIISIRIFNTIGQRHYVDFINFRNNEYIEVNTSKLPSGVYLLEILSDKQKIVKHFLKE